MRPRDDRPRNAFDLGLSRAEGELTELRGLLEADGKTLAEVTKVVGHGARTGDEIQVRVSELARALSADNRSIRDQIGQVSRGIEALEKRLAALESSDASLLTLIDTRLRSITQQVSVSLASIILIAVVVGVILLVWK